MIVVSVIQCFVLCRRGGGGGGGGRGCYQNNVQVRVELGGRGVGWPRYINSVGSKGEKCGE